MRQHNLTFAAAPASAIGFGCASLGSRVSARDAGAALERALAAGITWFDVAPSYGDGNAEVILGQFARHHRGAVNICTKVGIQANRASWKALVRPLARTIVGALPGLRKVATRARSVTKLPLTPEGITASVEQSLTRLAVERIDMLMLHDPAPDNVLRDDIGAALQRLLASGKVAAVGVAGDLAAARNGATRPELFTSLQFANNPFEANAQQDFVAAWRDAGKLVITHSALGAYGALPTLTALLAGNAEARQTLAAVGYEGEAGVMAAQFLTDYALATNAGGIALFSVAKPSHLEALAARAAALRPTDQMLALAAGLVSINQDRP